MGPTRRSEALARAALESIRPRRPWDGTHGPVLTPERPAPPVPQNTLSAASMAWACGMPSLIAIPMALAIQSSLPIILLAWPLGSAALLALCATWSQRCAMARSLRARELFSTTSKALGGSFARDSPDFLALEQFSLFWRSRHVRDRQALLAGEAIAANGLRLLSSAKQPSAEQARDILSAALSELAQWHSFSWKRGL